MACRSLRTVQEYILITIWSNCFKVRQSNWWINPIKSTVIAIDTFRLVIALKGSWGLRCVLVPLSLSTTTGLAHLYRYVMHVHVKSWSSVTSVRTFLAEQRMNQCTSSWRSNRSSTAESARREWANGWMTYFLAYKQAISHRKRIPTAKRSHC